MPNFFNNTAKRRRSFKESKKQSLEENKVFIEWKFHKCVCVCVWAKSHTPLGLSFPNGHLEDFVIERSIIAFCPTVLRKDPKPCFFIYEHSPQVNVTRRDREQVGAWGIMYYVLLE